MERLHEFDWEETNALKSADLAVTFTSSSELATFTGLCKAESGIRLHCLLLVMHLSKYGSKRCALYIRVDDLPKFVVRPRGKVGLFKTATMGK